MNWILILLFMFIIGLVRVIVKLRADLVETRWRLQRLTFLITREENLDPQVWDYVGAQALIDYIEGETTLSELFKQIQADSANRLHH
jgi:hypothetical protein